MPVIAPRLPDHRLLATTDLDEAREGVAGELCPHDLVPRSRWGHDDVDVDGARGRGGFSLRHHRAAFADVSLHWIDYGSDVEVRVSAMPFWLVQVPLAGAAQVDDGGSGGRRGVAGAGAALVCGPGSPWRMRYAPGTPRVMLQVPSALVHRRRELAGLPTSSSRSGRGAAPVLDLAAGPGAAFRRLLDVALDDVEAMGSAGPVPLATRSLAVALVDSLVSAQHAASGSEDPGALRPAASRGCVARAVQHAEEHCDEPLTTADIAAAVGVGVRALQAGYAQHLGETPMGHLRRVRLQRVREDLCDGSAGSVTEAAARWGLSHLGRLSVQYREAFGESPSTTLRRSR